MGYAFGYQPEQGWYAGSDIRYERYHGHDENTAKAPSTVVGLTTGYKWSYGRMDMDLFGRIDNLFDREYVGSVIVNESNGRYYELPGRNYGIGLNLAGASNNTPFPPMPLAIGGRSAFPTVYSTAADTRQPPALDTSLRSHIITMVTIYIDRHFYQP